MSELPVVVIGAGPQGLAAAAHLIERGVDVVVLEAASSAGAAVGEWGHVRLFSEWTELIDSAARRLLEPTGWAMPSGYPTGAEWVADYLAPLGTALGDRVRYNSRVVGVGRKGRDLLVDAGRSEQPFTVHVRDELGDERRVEARAVIDASGTWSTPSPAGADGLPALGEKASGDRVSHRIPNFADPSPFAGRRTVVVGAGHSAVTAINELARIARETADTRIEWVLRRPDATSAFGGGVSDELAERGALGLRAKAAVDEGLVTVHTGFRVEAFERDGAHLTVVSEDGRRIVDVDEVVVLTGFRPDLTFLSEIRLELDMRLQAPTRIAADVDPNLHSCGSVRATGAFDISHPETDFYLVGAKSYGRAPTFLALTGYEQVRSVVAAIAGDHEAAGRVELVLPETGVCGGAGVFDSPESAGATSCCSPSAGPQPVQVGLMPIGR